MSKTNKSLLVVALCMFSAVSFQAVAKDAGASVTEDQINELRQSADYALSEEQVALFEKSLSSTNPVMVAMQRLTCLNIGNSVAYLHVKVTLDPESDKEIAPIRDRLFKLNTICSSIPGKSASK